MILPNIFLDPKPIDGGNNKPVVQKNLEQAIKPIMPSVVPQEVLGTTFSVEQLPQLGDDEGGPVGDVVKIDATKKEIVPTKVEEGIIPPTDEKPKVEEKKIEEPKTEISKHLKPPVKAGEQKKDEKKDEKKEPQVTVPKNEFDYAGYSQEEVNHLKNMSVASRKFAGELIKNNKELAKQKDSNYLQHPDAYKLDPQYNAGLLDIQYANKEALFWQQQLEQAKLGKKVRNLVSWDVNGNPVVGEEIDSNDAIEERLRLNYQNSINVGNSIGQKLKEFPSKYQQQINTDLQAINAKKNELFEWNTKPELLDYSINIQGMGDRTIKQIKEDFKTLLPAYMRNHISSDIAADLMVALRIRDSELAEARALKEVTDTKMEEVKRAEPSSSIKPGRELAEVHGVKEFSGDLPDFS